ncbi:carbohydrate ABC transporter permease [Actinokineospora bangkokensis]|uniref:Sugar ABC transporter permease n=1 Tax=Actinokineospora bangkokensis TaxID=1193682 RepID=A0A1Q9LJU4_9PSEU|nr:sugar ABC transporter permease [Actinokineospora bangkokensis]OLR92327.1 sugar ABC transporter permease [Actinokineospora bangkokensis]
MARARRAGGGQEARAAWAFLSPYLLVLVLFALLPLVWAVTISFQRDTGFGDASWTGLDNYTRLLGDPHFWRATANTALFTAVVTPVSMALGLGAAVLLNSLLPARGFFRSVVVLPMAVSGVATALTGALVFNENNGVLNGLLGALGLPAVQWQSGGTAAFASVVLVTLWWRVGFNALIYLAGLQNVDPTLHEACRLDGANGWQRFRAVTVPALAPSSFFLVVMNVIYSFQVFDIVFVLTGGGPRDATSVLVTYAYDTAFTTRDHGYSAAIGVVLLLLTLAFTVLRWRAARSAEVTG